MEPKTQPRIADYVRPLISRWWLIVTAVVVATGGVYAYYAHKSNVYTASTQVYVQEPGDPVTGLPTPQQTDRDVIDQASLLDSRDNAAVVKSRIGYAGTPEALLQQVSITSQQGEDFVNISANAGTPGEAAAIANAFAARFVTFVTSDYLNRISRALKLSQTQLTQTPGGAASSVQRANLLDQINRLQLALRVPTTIGQQVNRALPPTSPSAPKPFRNALFAFIIALVGALAVAYGLERFDRRLRNPEEMERAYGAPLLAVLPHAGDPAPMPDGEPALGHDFREPFRVLRTNIELASVDAPPRTIVVSSAMPGEGKSTVARNLALAFRETGKKVAIVDLDLRHPALPRVFGLPLGPGVTEAMRGELDLDDVMMRVSVNLAPLDDLVRATRNGASARSAVNGNGTTAGNGSASGSHALTVVQSGARPANPPAVLASERIVEVLNGLRDRHDIVLIDSAPVLAVTDTVPLLRYADAAVFVGRLDVTTRDTAKRLNEFLARVPDVNVLGMVANDLSRLDASGYGYGYGYGSAATTAKTSRFRRTPKPTAYRPPKLPA
jgi:Mrp family chromosome partitioning ATPase/capsular polysaccharide biosynthesis protein